MFDDLDLVVCQYNKIKKLIINGQKHKPIKLHQSETERGSEHLCKINKGVVPVFLFNKDALGFQ